MRSCLLYEREKDKMTDCEIDRERIKDRGVHKATSPSETVALLIESFAYLHTFLHFDINFVLS